MFLCSLHVCLHARDGYLVMLLSSVTNNHAHDDELSVQYQTIAHAKQDQITATGGDAAGLPDILTGNLHRLDHSVRHAHGGPKLLTCESVIIS